MIKNTNQEGELPKLGSGAHECTVASYLTTVEAAGYMRKSTSWLLRQPGMPYLPGRPNLYKKSDLDRWFERKKFRPRVV